MEQLRRSGSQEDVAVVYPAVREELESKQQEVRPEVNSTATAGYSTGQTAADMLYNVFWGASTWVASAWKSFGTDSVRERRREVEDVAKSNPQKFAAMIEKVEVGCGREGATAQLLFDYFGEGKPLEAYLLPTGIEVGALMQAVENPALPHNVKLLGRLKEEAYLYSDNVRDTILPMMSDKGISLERKVVELQLLASLDDRGECSSTVLMSVITCFDRLSSEDQGILLAGHYEDLEGAPLEEFRNSDKIDYIRDNILVEFVDAADPDAMDLARIESMQFYADRNQPSTVTRLYLQLCEETQEVLAAHEKAAQKREERDIRPIPWVGGFSYFNEDPTGEFAKEALAAFIAAKV